MVSYLEYQVPFCKPFNCSFDSLNEMYNDTSHVLWDCVPENCKVNVSVFLSLTVILAAVTITFNCLILGINLASKTRRMRKRNPTMRNYSVYVVSLAMADFLVGVVVLPLCVINFYLEFKVDEISAFREVDATTWGTLASSSTKLLRGKIVETSGDSTQVFTTAAAHSVRVLLDQSKVAIFIRGALGIFTHLTLFVSVYTLITASADRFYAATCSVNFSTSRITKSATTEKKTCCLRRVVPPARRSTVAVCSVWLLGILFAVLPLAMNDIHFRHVGHIFAAMTSDEQYSSAVRWYLITLVLPLIGMWLLNLMICFALWRRKRQLGLRRKRSLHQKRATETQRKQPPSPRMASNSDSVFEQGLEEEGHIVKKYPASRWNREDSTEATENKTPTTARRPLYRSKPSNASVGTPKSPRSFLGVPKSPGSLQSFNWESKGTVLRRKVSSIRRAKEMLRRQSYEANITKTLCIVVIAFTLAVLPLIISLSKISVDDNSTKDVLNKEVTALTCSLFLLFSNSFVNCVIYGARMRDFRKTLCQLLRTFIDKIKNMLCCCCGKSDGTFSSEVVSGVFLLTKHQRPENPVSPRTGFGHDSEKLRFFSRSSSKLARSREPTLDRKYTGDENHISSIPPRKFYPINCDGLAVNDCRNPRPSSSGYRTDPEPHSTQDEVQTKRYSQRCDKDDLNITVTKDCEIHLDVAVETAKVKTDGAAGATSREQEVESSPLSDVQIAHDDRVPELSVVVREEEERTPKQTDSKGEGELELLRHAYEGKAIKEDDKFGLRNSCEFTLDIDFSQFST